MACCFAIAACSIEDNQDANRYDTLQPIADSQLAQFDAVQGLETLIDSLLAGTDGLAQSCHFVVNSLYHLHELGIDADPGIDFSAHSLLAGWVVPHPGDQAIRTLTLEYCPALDLYRFTIGIDTTSLAATPTRPLAYACIYPKVQSEVQYHIVRQAAL